MLVAPDSEEGTLLEGAVDPLALPETAMVVLCLFSVDSFKVDPVLTANGAKDDPLEASVLAMLER